ncbi:hypothetical protein GGI23_003881 [Coemansia sp. RSA 2559]|nr:hypothetical protein GGI23_003881 [Coemansia sp. RSA 2559]
MEFRRMSRMSLGKASALSPVGGGSDARAPGNGAHDRVSPLSRPLPKQKQQKQSPLHNIVPAPATASSRRSDNSQTASMQSTSLLHATASNSAEPPSPVAARAAADKFSEAITPRVLRRSSSSRSRAGSGDASGGGSGKELFAKMRGSVDRMVSQRWRGGTLGSGGPASKHSGPLRRGSNHALSLIKESDVAAESDDEWQVLSHVTNPSTLTPEQQLAQLIAENRQLKTHVSQAKKAIDALTRVVIRMQ